MSRKASETVYRCREALSEFFSSEAPENTVFTLNTTYALNLAVKALLREGDHALISNIEHNAVYRSIAASCASYDIFNSFSNEGAVLDNIKNKLKPNTRLIVCNHMSNICPIRNPITAIGELAKSRGIYFIVDAAQSAGILPINMKQSKIDALCIPGHKSLYGIQGCGAVLFSKRFCNEGAKRLSTLIQGGNGINSLEKNMPDFLPERLEAGTLSTPAIAGLLEGVRVIKRIGTEHIREHEYALYRRLHDNLCNFKDIKLYCRNIKPGNTLLFNLNTIPSTALADELDKHGVCVRGGFHCAPLPHGHLKTGENGAVRVSFGAFNTLEEVDRFTDILYKIKQTGI